MVHNWYFSHDEVKLGPFSGGQLKELAAAGQVLPTDTVWMEGVAKGAPAGKVRYLFAAPVALAAVSATTTPEAASPAPPFGGWPEPASDREAPTSRPPPADVQRATAAGGKGIIIVGQDGATVKYRTKCTVCGYADSHWNSMNITKGSTRVSFYCPKCRRNRGGEIRGSVA